MAQVMMTLRDIADGAVDVDVVIDPAASKAEDDTPAQALACVLLAHMQSVASGVAVPPVLTLPTVDPERPGQFVGDLLAVAETHATAAGSITIAADLLLAAAIAAAERHGTAPALATELMRASAAVDRRHGGRA